MKAKLQQEIKAVLTDLGQGALYATDLEEGNTITIYAVETNIIDDELVHFYHIHEADELLNKGEFKVVLQS